MTRTAPAQWAFDHIVEIDRHTPFCGAFFRASDERRQIIAAYLSAKPPTSDEMGDVGRFLLEADHRAILERAYGSYIKGHRGALRRVGDVVAEVRVYTLLHQLLADPELPEITDPQNGIVSKVSVPADRFALNFLFRF